MDTLSPEERSERMSRVRSRNTSPEMLTLHLARKLGYRFQLHSKNLPGRPDLVFVGRRKVIFVHGCFWHRHNRCALARLPKSNQDFWASKFDQNRRRDASNRAALTRLGWTSLVIWECELRDPVKVMLKMLMFMEK